MHMIASTTKTVLVTSATGVQGRAVIDALLSSPTAPPSFHVLALTRDLRSTGAMDLAARYPNDLTVVEADFASPESVRKLSLNEKMTVTGKPVWGVYLVAPCSVASNAKEEERQGKVITYTRIVPYHSRCLIADSPLR
jgi:uncharacterized protein YbjT (DUF2867 family)